MATDSLVEHDVDAGGLVVLVIAEGQRLTLSWVQTSQGVSQEPTGGSMKLEWHKPEVTEQEVGLEVTCYLAAELDKS